nr:class I SAM-dependent methyltransferase [Bacteroidales bacterium]
MNTIRFILKYLKFLNNAKSRHRIHSPFIFTLINECLDAEDYNPNTEIIETLRANLLKNNNTINVDDLGTGKSGLRKVSDIAKKALKSQQDAMLLYKLAKFFQSKTIVELGTSFGITTIYLATAGTNSEVYTIEGSKEIADIAVNNFKLADIENITVINDNIEKALPELLLKINKPDMVFFDANHTKDATIKYFEFCLPYIKENTVLIFDDIHWSDQMEQAWEHIKKHQDVTITVDLFFFGLVFF